MKHVDVIFIGRIESRLLRGQSSSVERCFEHSDKRHLFRFFIIRIIELLGLFFMYKDGNSLNTELYTQI